MSCQHFLCSRASQEMKGWLLHLGRGGFPASYLPPVQSCRATAAANSQPVNADKFWWDRDRKTVVLSGLGDKKSALWSCKRAVFLSSKKHCVVVLFLFFPPLQLSPTGLICRCLEEWKTSLAYLRVLFAEVSLEYVSCPPRDKDEQEGPLKRCIFTWLCSSSCPERIPAERIQHGAASGVLGRDVGITGGVLRLWGWAGTKVVSVLALKACIDGAWKHSMGTALCQMTESSFVSAGTVVECNFTLPPPLPLGEEGGE